MPGLLSKSRRQKDQVQDQGLTQGTYWKQGFWREPAIALKTGWGYLYFQDYHRSGWCSRVAFLDSEYVYISWVVDLPNCQWWMGCQVIGELEGELVLGEIEVKDRIPMWLWPQEWAGHWLEEPIWVPEPMKGYPGFLGVLELPQSHLMWQHLI